MNLERPVIVISLDFELHWGRFDKYSLADYQAYYAGTQYAVPKILRLFEKYKIHATWATVGMLLAKNWEEWESYRPNRLPNYEQPKYSAYEWAKDRPGLNGLFAPDLALDVSQTSGQEIASHTFSHFYTLEKGADLAAFQADLSASKKISQDKLGIEPVSLVFPRNQYDENSIQAAMDLGFKNFRTNPKDWFWENAVEESLAKKIFRTGDTLYPLGKRSSYSEPKISGESIEIPASRLLRPYRKGSVFNQLRIKRIKSELVESCKRNEIYHLWWHPHNFGHLPKENLQVLEDLLIFINELTKSKGLQSMSMNELAENIMNSKKKDKSSDQNFSVNYQ
ncbi:polysaccharide deacetylase family protein [Algoriphagus hitonicola]|uniref:polysaccharide deacetylase family protein n=1 Tax=Algoriphagus hitonicola TaxID=435880 RepID=UPI003618129E